MKIQQRLNRITACGLAGFVAFGTAAYKPLGDGMAYVEAKEEGVLQHIDKNLQNGVNLALRIAGSNKSELMDAMTYFYEQLRGARSADLRERAEARFKGVCFLIAESAYRFRASYPRGEQTEEGTKPKIMPDPQKLSSDFLIAHVEQRYSLREEQKYAWSKDISDPIFYSSVLGYRGQTERVPKDRDEMLESYLFDRQKFDQLKLGVSFEEFHGKIKQFSDAYKLADQKGDIEGKKKAIEDLLYYINTEVLHVKAKKEYVPRGPEDRFWFNAVTDNGRCTDRCHATMFFLRALGLPAVHDRVILWGDVDTNHTWVVVEMPFKTYSIDGGCPCGEGGCVPDYYRAQGYEWWQKKGEKKPENYRGRSYAVIVREQWGAPADQYNQIARAQYIKATEKGLADAMPFGNYYYILGTNGTIYDSKREIVGSHYYVPQTINFRHPQLKAGELYYLAVFNGGQFSPLLPAYASGFATTLKFGGVTGGGTLYAVVKYEVIGGKEKTTIIGNPFTAQTDGSLIPFGFDSKSKKTPVEYPFETGKTYWLYAYDGHTWVVTEKFTALKGKSIPLQENMLYYVKEVADYHISEQGFTFYNLPRGAYDNKYTLSKLNKKSGEWEPVYIDPQNPNLYQARDGSLTISGLDPTATYALEPYNAPGVRPFTFRNGKLRRFGETNDYK